MPKLEEIPEIKFSRRRDLVIFELLALEFPDALARDVAHFILEGDSDYQLTDQSQFLELKDNAAQLKCLSDQNLNDFYLIECKRNGKDAHFALQIKRTKWFFNKPKARADFSFWVRSAYWSLTECAVLSLGKDPRVITTADIRSLHHPILSTDPLFPRQYFRRLDLITRAWEMKDLPEKVRPADFVEWARKIDLEIPTNLEEQLEQLEIGGSASWDHFDEESETYPRELHVAVRAWRAVHHQTDTTTTPKERIRNWVRKYFPDLSNEAVERIAMVCNWDRRGGRKRKE